MGLISNLFSNNNSLTEYINKGAVVIDVRSSDEFQGGHVKGAKNIPLPSIESQKNQIIKLNKPVILCCASGMRSGQATSILKNAGVDCINGGGWTKVNAAMN